MMHVRGSHVNGTARYLVVGQTSNIVLTGQTTPVTYPYSTFGATVGLGESVSVNLMSTCLGGIPVSWSFDLLSVGAVLDTQQPMQVRKMAKRRPSNLQTALHTTWGYQKQTAIRSVPSGRYRNAASPSR
jgi:hypothetical protein